MSETRETPPGFKSGSQNNIMRLHKNMYINRSDPQYHEKVLRYLDSRSPEAHYRLGQHLERKGLSERALLHYQEVMRTYPSPYYYEASTAIRRMSKPETKQIPPDKREAGTAIRSRPRPVSIVPTFMKIGLLALLFINLILLALLYGPATVTKAVSALKPWSIGTDVTFESAETAFLMNFAYGESSGQVEKALHKKAVELSHTYPKQSILIYGVSSSAPTADLKAVPLSDVSWKDKAFVVAEYNPLIDGSVRIRFLHPEFQKQKPLTEAAANVVRTALQAFIEENGSAPPSVDLLRSNYPDNYLSFIPIESASGSADVRAVFDGSGGWVYEPAEREPERMFYPNVQPPRGEEGRVPFQPVKLIVDRDTHMLLVETGGVKLAQVPVGLGAENRTPVGTFPVRERVIDPAGKQPGIYGAAALSLGAIAIHGTPDVTSVGEDRSLGCIRLANDDMAAIFPYVPRGAQVEIREGVISKSAEGTSMHPVALELLYPEAHRQAAIDETAGRKVFHWLG